MSETVGARLARILVQGGVGAVFGVPGGQTLPLYAAVEEVGLQHVLMRDERSAACAADAYARLSGSVGFCDATVGPGVTNLVSGLAEAYGSSIPVVAIVADIRRDRAHLRRRAVASQALEQAALLAPVTKWVGRVETVDGLESVLGQALRVATSGRPGPVVLEIPEDVFAADAVEDAEYSNWGPEDFSYPRFRSAPPPDVIEHAAELLAKADRPLILAGGGVTFSDASEAVRRLSEEQQIPIATSISGKGTADETSLLSAGVAGSFGTVQGNIALRAADVVLVLGCKLGSLTTHNWQLPSPDQVVIHVDVDGEELGRTGPVTLGIVSDVREAADAIADALNGREVNGNWLDTLDDNSGVVQPDTAGAVAPHLLAGILGNELSEKDVLVCDASLSSGWGAAFVPVRRPRSFIAPRGLAGIGWGGGGVIGARIATPSEQRMVLLTGDGAWGYCLSEFETAARLDLDLTYIVLNNAALGWITHIEQRREQPLRSLFSDVDFSGVARAMGGEGSRVTNLEDFEEALQVGLSSSGPYLIDVLSSQDASPILSLEDVPETDVSDAYS
jgi:acetolactate synthase-1/2/3 large subunit